jgi:hypothetical protein
MRQSSGISENTVAARAAEFSLAGRLFSYAGR